MPGLALRESLSGYQSASHRIIEHHELLILLGADQPVKFLGEIGIVFSALNTKNCKLDAAGNLVQIPPLNGLEQGHVHRARDESLLVLRSVTHIHNADIIGLGHFGQLLTGDPFDSPGPQRVRLHLPARLTRRREPLHSGNPRRGNLIKLALLQFLGVLLSGFGGVDLCLVRSESPTGVTNDRDEQSRHTKLQSLKGIGFLKVGDDGGRICVSKICKRCGPLGGGSKLLGGSGNRLLCSKGWELRAHSRRRNGSSHHSGRPGVGRHG
mmetsp:Transcript_17345/g.27554  ORF Transcript_17345/g.27554 Transcript_17345/m.27554 type:complete len:267 (+) Transcript_17345:558-1358(+)